MMQINKTLTALRPIKKYILKYWKIFAFGCLFLILSNIIQICEPIIINNGFNALKKDYMPFSFLYRLFGIFNINTKFEMLTFFAVLYLTVMLIQLPLIYFYNFLITSTSYRIENDLKNDLFCHLQKLPLSFFRSQKTGDILARFSNDTKCIHNLTQVGISFANYLILAPISIIYLYIIGKTLILFSIIPLIGMAITTYIFSKVLRKHSSLVQEHFGVLSTKAQENFSGMKIIKIYAQGNNEIRKYLKISKENIKKNMGLQKIHGLGLAIVFLLAGLSQLVLLWLGCSFIISGKITSGNFAAFYYQLNHLVWPIFISGASISLFQESIAHLERINDIFLQVSDTEDSKNIDYGITSITGDIEFRNLNFSYEKDGNSVLRNMNLSIEKGKTIGIIGNIGSGKSTLANLLLRLFKAPKGTIFIDRYPIEKIPLKTLRTSIGYVTQETFLFSGTIKENICFGSSSQVSQEELDRACAFAAIKKDIDNFPQGYETIVGEKGITLSGGQRQRIAIARAIILKPKILILDNALSHIDLDTERTILTNIKKDIKNYSIIFISNKVSTIKEADLIVVLVNGQIVETGTHDELLKVGGLYQTFYKGELLEEELITL